MKKSFLVLLFIVLSFNFFSLNYVFNSYNNNFESKHFIGELYGGGIIFYIYLDEKGNEHGLIASLSDLSSSCFWGFYGINLPNCNSSWDGKSNTMAIIEGGGEPNNAAGLCVDYVYKEYLDWYLPSIDELNLLFNQRYIINKILDNDSDPATIGMAQKYYWSSTQNSASHAWYFNAGAGIADDGSKNNLPSPHVRAIRSF